MRAALQSLQPFLALQCPRAPVGAVLVVVVGGGAAVPGVVVVVGGWASVPTLARGRTLRGRAGAEALQGPEFGIFLLVPLW